jgi:thiosulfate/3-mercaptopyruvate sulfurtransferase
LEPWEKVLVNPDFMDTVHGSFSCISCHGGQQSAEKDSAHEGVMDNPNANPQNQCGACHAETVASSANSLHSTLAGYWTVLDARSAPDSHAKLEEAYGNHCASCHTTCGDCHISQPSSVGGGLLNGHLFEKTPPMTRTCTACHGSRVGAEYLGKHEDIPGDVHFRQARMNCIACHTGTDLHAASTDDEPHRYAGAQIPSCKDCHAEVGASGDPILQHGIHQDKLSCQVCHSVEYTSCDGCHVAISEKTGNAFFKTEADYLTFFIGKNPRQDENRPYEYVPLRHVPVASTSFEFYGENLLPNFNNLPTWAYATPHNIQRKTPQNASCKACHGNPDIFLTADKVKPEELDANLPVIVDQVPSDVGP